MRRGIVKWFDKHLNYGFIKTEGGDIFLHGDYWLIPDRLPRKGELIEFEVDEDKKGIKAINVNRVFD